MGRIRQLPPGVINQIAAGEVIERPASVLKELVENSLDAGATRIDVLVEKSGTELIQVSDNGHGILPDDIDLATMPHATSKLTTAEDLFGVRTLGFRGEALASIAEVSHFSLRSRPADQAEGYSKEVHAGQHEQLAPCACAVGTTVTVRQLFCNTPVRRRFLKSAATEMGHLTEAFTRLALAVPEVHFTLRHGNRGVYDLPPGQSWLERIAGFFGPELARDLIQLENQDGDLKLWGYVAPPAHYRSHPRMQHLFVNGRFVRDRALQHALQEAYRGLLLTGRYPVAFVAIEMPSEMVDVNVHPTKMEVRLQDGGRVYSQLLGTIRKRFLSADLTAKMQVRETGDPQEDAAVPLAPLPDRRPEFVNWATQQVQLWGAPQGEVVASSVSTNPSEPQGETAALLRAPEPPGAARTEATPRDRPRTVPAEEFHYSGQPLSLHRAETVLPSPMHGPAGAAATAALGLPPISRMDYLAAVAQSPASQLPTLQSAVMNGPPLPAMARDPALAHDAPVPFTRVDMGTSTMTGQPAPVVAIQIHNRYLVAETPEGLVVVDQHALHERVLYERLKARVASQSPECQPLLIPEPVDLDGPEAAALLEKQAELQALGFEMEAFGGSTLLVRAYPAMLPKPRLLETVRHLASLLLAGKREPEQTDILDRLLHSMACKAAVKAGDRLSPAEVAALLADRHLVQDAHHCPHGRPTALVFTKEDLDRQFQRT